MTVVTVLPRRPLTVDDLDAMPDDGHRYELIDGTLIVSPAPLLRHQLVHSRLMRLLLNATPSHLEVLSAPTDIVLADDTVVQPDLLVVPLAQIVGRKLMAPPLLAVEILSPSSRLIDLNLKRARYERAGVPSYWVVDPDELRLVAWRLSEGAYVDVADVAADETWRATDPFDVTITPRDLAAGAG
ncbi:MAG: Uma2 family endonuclease [Propionibacteriales bacterium]|nr:Uma2 family endonuclease [Propionibacteriales bacterium]